MQTIPKRLDPLPLIARNRYRLLLAADSRLQDGVQTQMEAQEATSGMYFQVVSADLPSAGSLWSDASQAEIDAIGRLPGVMACEVMRPDSLGTFQVEASAGPSAAALVEVLRQVAYKPVLDHHVPGGQGIVASAWRSGQIRSSRSYRRDARSKAWQDVLHRFPSLRSVLAIPVLDRQGHPVLAIVIQGDYPNQFESSWMQQFAKGLQQRWAEVWQRCRTPDPGNVLPHELAQVYKERLLSGSLSMHFQPVVDLRSGELSKVEALARLQLDEGRLIAPGLFLPLLGNAELNHLFRQGLDQTLRQLVAWDAQGLAIGASINLAPTTLLDEDCPRWVEEALARHGVAPQRLSLELLETEGMDSNAQEEAIRQLMRLGVRLAMDDLGSGYGSLQRLSALPFDTIKIDQSLTLNLRKAPLLSLPVIRAIIQLGDDLDRHVVVEGLEDRGMIEAALILGATLGQGYGIAKPMPPEQLMGWHKAFRPPVQPGSIHTFLGALAHHWLHTLSAMAGARIPLDACPVTHFLEEQSWRDREAAAWHAQCHAEGNVQAMNQRLTTWFVERVVAEGWRS
ncbi:oxygen sensor protein DosP [mine drainage metagenome]|uniref:Oxygen sensor protein DosP n=1 Tax=mine drainage metagenome TaxID=410659 RepID=A0A1J5PYJ7_9ZZZZ